MYSPNSDFNERLVKKRCFQSIMKYQPFVSLEKKIFDYNFLIICPGSFLQTKLAQSRAERAELPQLLQDLSLINHQSYFCEISFQEA